MRTPTIDENTDRACDCCQRTHRKLFLVDGYWLGQNCKDSYILYRNFPKNPTAQANIGAYFSANQLKRLRAM